MTDLDILADLDPLELSKTPEKLDTVIAYYRKQRANSAKPKKEQGPAGDLSSVISALTQAPTAPAAAPSTFKRRV